MGRSKFAHARGLSLRRTSKFAIVIGALSMVGTGAQLACAAENGGSLATPASADAVNQALLKKIEAMEQRIKSLEAQVKPQNGTSTAGKPAASDVAGATKQSDKSPTDKSQADKSNAAGDQSTKPDTASDQSRTANLDKAAGLDKAAAQPAA